MNFLSRLLLIQAVGDDQRPPAIRDEPPRRARIVPGPTHRAG
jgi:hypothetical protein